MKLFGINKSSVHCDSVRINKGKVSSQLACACDSVRINKAKVSSQLACAYLFLVAFYSAIVWFLLDHCLFVNSIKSVVSVMF